MGCDIHAYAEKKNGDTWEVISVPMEFFENRSYGKFGWLAGVRNYSAVTPISEPRGIPEDVSAEVKGICEDWGCDGHTFSWLSLDELTAFDFDAQMEDRRVTRRVAAGYMDGGQTCDPGDGEKTTWREFLGTPVIDEIFAMKAAGAERIVFFFDN